jgi:hypothetical protein
VKPICYDLFCGLGGWSEGFLAEGYECIGYDIEAHDYGTGGYPGELNIRDVRGIHGSELKDATCIVGSSPCQEFSYRAMPWKRAKALPPPYLGIELFNAQFRIQREAIEAAGHYIPLVVENVRGAQKWVGRANWNYGSFYLWGDVPALMPLVMKAQKFNPDGANHGTGSWFAIADSKNRGASKCTCPIECDCANPEPDDPETVAHCSEECPIHNLNPRPALTCAVHGEHVSEGLKMGWDNSVRGKLRRNDGLKGIPHRTSGHWTNPAEHEGVKEGGDWWNKECRKTGMAQFGSKSNARKRASAMIAKIPFPLALHIARVFKP